jgi:hypothetical protein
MPSQQMINLWGVAYSFAFLCWCCFFRGCNDRRWLCWFWLFIWHWNHTLSRLCISICTVQICSDIVASADTHFAECGHNCHSVACCDNKAHRALRCKASLSCSSPRSALCSSRRQKVHGYEKIKVFVSLVEHPHPEQCLMGLTKALLVLHPLDSNPLHREAEISNNTCTL